MSELISAVKNLQSARASKIQTEHQSTDFSPEPIETKNSEKKQRVRGKRSNPSFEQVTAYIRKDTYLKAKMALLQEGRDFSDLVEELVSAYLRTQTRELPGTRAHAQTK
ncbi:MAG TPA: hypothetical protein V6C86_10285 [Oculatellaceae cyanobacterium]|jgi:hypothetical protein